MHAFNPSTWEKETDRYLATESQAVVTQAFKHSTWEVELGGSL